MRGFQSVTTTFDESGGTARSGSPLPAVPQFHSTPGKTPLSRQVQPNVAQGHGAQQSGIGAKLFKVFGLQNQ